MTTTEVELLAEVKNLGQAVTRLTASIDQLVRKDVYVSDQRTIDQRFSQLEKDVAVNGQSAASEIARLAARIDGIESRAEANRRMMIASFIAPIVVGLILFLAIGGHS